jgi:putative SOS response-associated peptidase YedK
MPMNERYALTAGRAELTRSFRLDRIEFPYEERDDYRPTGQIPVIRPIGGERYLSGQRWGLMPYWGKSSIRTDRDTLGDKPYLMAMLARKRCVVPCSGLVFERAEGKERRTYMSKHPEKAVFGVAGLYDVWLDSERNEFPMCTMVCTRSTSSEGIVPVVLEGEAMEEWLDPGRREADSLRRLLRSLPEAEFRTEPALPLWRE